MSTQAGAVQAARSYRYYDLILGAYVCIGASKVTTLHLPWIGSVTFIAGVLFFPISYFFGDVLTEVYGYARDRRCVWAGFGAILFASVMSAVIVHLPPAEFWKSNEPAIEAVFGNTPRIAAASIIAFWCGSFVNSYVLAKMKILTRGRFLWTRTIGSTACGELVDSTLFCTLAFAGVWTPHDLLTVTVTQYVLKTSWEVVSTPFTYWIVGFLKRTEHEDYFDRDTNFNPFSLELTGAGARPLPRSLGHAPARSAGVER
jgi:queuosine precursor transporter